MRGILLAATMMLATGAPAAAAELRGPGRFCAYSSMIDLLPGERIVTLQGGIHGGSFRWTGPWGRFTVSSSGLASPGDRYVVVERTHGGARRLAERRDGDDYVVPIGNEHAAAAWFRSRKPVTVGQLAAIDRVHLFDEGNMPDNCNLRMVFAWVGEE